MNTPHSDTAATVVAFLHTSPVHISTFDRLITERLPGFRTTHLVDESLLADARRDGLSADLGSRVAARITELAVELPATIVCTCSTIGPMVDAAAGCAPCPVVRGDRAVVEAAVAIAMSGSRRIGVAIAVESTAEPTLALIRTVAAERDQAISTLLIPCFDAWAVFEAGDMDGYARRIADTVRRTTAEDNVDVIVLAQASMAAARQYLRDLAVPVLSSPDQLVETIATAIETRLI
ncbi:MAG: aspartate/glutamate racemase family protein [Thermomicrobiales bacterium]